MQKYCKIHQELQIEFICLDNNCRNHLACFKCLKETHFNHIKQCILVNQIINTIQQQQLSLNNYQDQIINIQRQQWKYNTSFINRVISEIDNLEFSLLQSLNDSTNDLNFIASYNNTRNISEIQKLYKMYQLQQIQKNQFYIKLTQYLCQSKSKIIELQKLYQIQKNKQHFTLNQQSLLKLKNQFIYHIKQYQQQIANDVNTFQILDTNIGSVQYLQTNASQTVRLALYNKLFVKSKKYQIIIDFSELDLSIQGTIFIGFTRQKHISSINHFDSSAHGISYFAQLTQCSYTQVNMDTHPDISFGKQINQDLAKQSHNKSSKLELILDLKNKEIIITFKQHIVKYSTFYKARLEDSLDDDTYLFFNASIYKMYIMYRNQKFSCTAQHYLIE